VDKISVDVNKVKVAGLNKLVASEVLRTIKIVRVDFSKIDLDKFTCDIKMPAENVELVK